MVSAFLLCGQESVPENSALESERTQAYASERAARGESEILFPAASETVPSETRPPSTLWLFVRMILVLALVIAAIYGVIWLLKKSTKTPDVSNPYVRHTASITIAPGRTVHILTVGDRAFLIGASENSVCLLSEITDKELIDDMNLQADKNESSGGDFYAFLRSFFPGAKKNSAGGGAFSADKKNAERAETYSFDGIFERQRSSLRRSAARQTDLSRTESAEPPEDNS